MSSLARPLAIAGSLTILVGLAPTLLADTHSPVRVAELEFVFASPEQGRQQLSARDAYVERLSPFDRQARRQSAEPVGEAEYLEFVRGEVRPWDAEWRGRVTEALRSLEDPLSKLSLPELPQIQLIYTTGREESGAAYTRGNAIVLPQPRLRSGTPESLRTLLAHELFHVISRHHPALRDQVYAAIGFQPSNEIQLPSSLAPRRMTNPDAPTIEHVIELRVGDGPTVTVAPVLFAKEEYNPQSAPSFFAYLSFQLMEVERQEGNEYRAVVRAGQPVFHSPSEPDYMRQIGRNTGYIIHPEEVLADNFAMLVTGDTEVPDPWVIQALRSALTRS